MATPGYVDTESPRGDRYDHRLVFVDDDTGEPLDLTGLDFAAQLRRSADAADAVDYDVDDSDIATGVVILTLIGDVTKDLKRKYARDVQAIDGSSDPVTLITGVHTVNEDVTK